MMRHFLLQVLGADIVKSASRTFAVYSISVMDINNNRWSIKRRFRHFEELHQRLKEFPGYNLHLPPKRFMSTEAAYDMLLMQSLSQRRAGKVVDSNIRYADVKPLNAPGMGSMPQWLQTTVNNSSVSFEKPDAGDLGIQAGVYGALMVLNYANGSSSSSTVPYAGADVPGLILATSFGASLYFMTKKNIKLAIFDFTLSSRREQQNVESKESALPRKCNFDAIDSTLPTEILWPDGIFITKHPKRRRPNPSGSIPPSSSCGQLPTPESSPKKDDSHESDDSHVL
ncbi:hypothetical protein U1Q18_001776, partial [Sarracenia purpurea var. burkii]